MGDGHHLRILPGGVALPACPMPEFDWLEYAFGTRDTTFNLDALSTLRQIHSAHVVVAEGKPGCLGEGDALISNTPGVLLAIKTADCFPILLVDPVHHAVAAIHAGWRGAAKKIVNAVIGEMRERFHSDPADLHAAIGPGIQKCCFEVGPEVAWELAEINQRTHLDLDAIIQGQLVAAGIPPAQIYSSGLCTVCNPAQFYSWRRDGEAAGRMFAVIGIKKGQAGLKSNLPGRS